MLKICISRQLNWKDCLNKEKSLKKSLQQFWSKTKLASNGCRRILEKLALLKWVTATWKSMKDLFCLIIIIFVVDPNFLFLVKLRFSKFEHLVRNCFFLVLLTVTGQVDRGLSICSRFTHDHDLVELSFCRCCCSIVRVDWLKVLVWIALRFTFSAPLTRLMLQMRPWKFPSSWTAYDERFSGSIIVQSSLLRRVHFFIYVAAYRFV